MSDGFLFLCYNIYMAQYKVPQDVEADDKLIGPFSFRRQFVYLMIAGGLIAAAVGLFQIFPALAIIPVPFAFFFLALALPLKKDQPMETYLAALVSYYLKPRARVWMPGQKENPILITAPKKVDDYLTRDLTSEEATHRLSFLADIVDTEGYAIKGAGASPMREDLMAEANATPDMFETYQSQVINRVIDQDKMSRHQSAVNEMRAAIARSGTNTMMPEAPTMVTGGKVISRSESQVINKPVQPPAQQKSEPAATKAKPQPQPQPIAREIAKAGGLRDYAILKPDVDIENSDTVIKPEVKKVVDQKVTVPGMDYLMEREAMIDEAVAKPAEKQPVTKPAAEKPVAKPAAKKPSPKPVNNSIMELANNPDFTVATIAKEANRINRKEKNGEIFVSLH